MTDLTDIDAILASLPDDDPGNTPDDPWGGANLEPCENCPHDVAYIETRHELNTSAKVNARVAELQQIIDQANWDATDD